MLPILLLINPAIANAEKNFNDLFRSKVLEVSSFFFRNSEFLYPIFNDFEPKAEKILHKFKGQDLSKRNLKRMISDLENEWYSSMSLLESTTGLHARSGGQGPGVGLHLTSPDQDVFSNVDSKERQVLNLDMVEDIIPGSSILDPDVDLDLNRLVDGYLDGDDDVQKNQDEELVLSKREITITALKSARFFQEMLQNLMSLVFFFTVKLPLESVYKLFSPIFIHLISDFSIDLAKTVQLKLSQEPDLLVSRQDLRQDIKEFSKSAGQGFLESVELSILKDPFLKSEINQALTTASRSITSGILQESASHLPSKSSFILLFMAVPILISLIARMVWLQLQNSEYE